MKFVKSFWNLKYTYAYTLENLEVTMCCGMILNKDGLITKLNTVIWKYSKNKEKNATETYVKSKYSVTVTWHKSGIENSMDKKIMGLKKCVYRNEWHNHTAIWSLLLKIHHHCQLGYPISGAAMIQVVVNILLASQWPIIHRNNFH